MPYILIVDNDASIRRLLRVMLTFAGYSVLDAASGEQALELAAVESPDAIILDSSMRGMDGIEMATALRAHPATAAIPVILMTAGIRRRPSREAMLVDRTLPKPFTLQEVTASVRAVLPCDMRGSQITASKERMGKAPVQRPVVPYETILDCAPIYTNGRGRDPKRRNTESGP